MPRAAAGTPKAIANAIKAKGLGRLRWYCQVCEKQCRDENGFQAHTRSEPHMRKIMLVGPKAGKAISDFSQQFQTEFVSLLRTRHQTNRVRANAVYNEYIQDKHHVHMNATRWVTLSGFVGTLGKAGIVKVDEDERGLWIQWVDNSPKTLLKQAAILKRDRAQMDGEERERLVLAEQIKRAAAQREEQTEEVGLQKKEGEKISLSFNLGGPSTAADTAPSAEAGPSNSTADHLPSTSASTITAEPSAASSAPTTSISFSSTLPASVSASAPSNLNPAAPPAPNPLKRPAPMNVFKSAKQPKSDPDAASSVGGGQKKYMSEAERLMREDQARKFARGGGVGSGGGGGGGGGGYGGFGPKRDTNRQDRRFVLQ